jgi:tetratricopeptide (TPR) repeat protein
LEFYKKAANADPTFKEAYYRMGLIYEDREEYAKALELLEKATEVDPDYVVAQFRAGSILAKLGEADKAMRKLEVVAKADPESPMGKEAQEKISRLNVKRLSAKRYGR